MSDKKSKTDSSNRHYAGLGGMESDGPPRSRTRKIFDEHVNFCSHDAGPNHLLWKLYKKFIWKAEVKCRCCRDVRLILGGIVLGVALAGALMWGVNV